MVSSFRTVAALIGAILVPIAGAAEPEVVQRSKASARATFVVGRAAAIDVTPLAGLSLAESFLYEHGDLFGISAPARELRQAKVHADGLGHTHTVFHQVHEGIRVFSGGLKVHQDAGGLVYAANGEVYAVPSKLATRPAIDSQTAAVVARRAIDAAESELESTELVIVDPGWYGDAHIGVRLAHYLVLRDLSLPLREAFFVDAASGMVLDHWSILHTARFREVFDGQGLGDLPGLLVRSEGDPPVGGLEDANRAYDYSGDVYGYFERAFGRDSIDGMGMNMQLTVNSTAPPCPNAFWNGTQMVFCLGTVTDDITAHEIAHGVTDFTANLIYQNQSGQLNESFSDIFGELIDLFNGDAAFPGVPGGTPWPTHATGPGVDSPNNLRSSCSGSPDYSDGVRWLMGEDADAFGGSIRDMWDPPCEGDPDFANSSLQTCPGNDSGGVHSGSGIPNHAFAMLTDGKSFNGQTVSAIGPIKAGAVWYRALTVYLSIASDFEDAYVALNQSALDLVGTDPNDPRTGLPGGAMFTALDAEQVDRALLAVEMNTEGACGATVPVLDPTAPEECSQRTSIFADDFEGGQNGWSVSISGAPLNPYDWEQTALLPEGRPGTAWYILNFDDGCPAGGEESAVHILQSPAIAIPANVSTPLLRFSHFVATEPGYDGGNLKISIDGGAFEFVPASAFQHNAYNMTLNGGSNTNPLAGQPAYSGVGGGWGTSLVDLGGFVSGGESVVLAFEFGKDWCNGVEGWYVDDLDLYYCTCDQNSDCDDGEFCNGVEFCLGNLCQSGPAPCGTGYCDAVSQTCPTTALWEDFENGNVLGWDLFATGSDAATGAWEIGDPVGTTSGGNNAQPELAFAGEGCAFTAQNETAGNADVDDGVVYLESPPMNLLGQDTAELRFVRWFFQRDIDDDPNDYYVTEVSDNGGASWVTLETLDSSTSENFWTERSFALQDFVSLTSDVRVRFGVSDGVGEGDIIEGAVDNVAVVISESEVCLPPVVAVEGSRYFSATPGVVPGTVALRISGAADDPNVSCWSSYVQLDGSLSPVPAFHTVAEWGTVLSTGTQIIPSAFYEVVAECDLKTSTSESKPVALEMAVWGDVEIDGAVNFADVQLVVQGFQSDFSNVSLAAADLEPCQPNQVVNFADILLDVQAFQGQGFESAGCAVVCE